MANVASYIQDRSLKIEESELTLLEVLGTGSSGEISRDFWKTKGIDVAVKRIGKTLLYDQQNDNIRKEITFLETLTHANIIKYYGYVETETHLMIVTELAEKGSLYEYLRHQSQLPQDLKVKWQLQIASSIQYLHDQQVYHGDIKTPNIVITAQDDIKLCDFGTARTLEGTVETKSTIGTIKWQAPEVLITGILSLKADIFALGIVFWELETCEEPYKNYTSFVKIALAVTEEKVRPAIPVTFSPRIAKLIELCWDEDRSKRPDITDVVKQLKLYKNDPDVKLCSVSDCFNRTPLAKCAIHYTEYKEIIKRRKQPKGKYKLHRNRERFERDTARRQGLLLFALFWLNFFQYGSLRAFVINMPLLIDQLGLDMEVWAVGGTLYIAAAMETLPGPIWKGIADKMGKRAVIILGTILMSVGLIVSSLSQVSYTSPLHVGMFLSGIGSGLLMVSKITIIRHCYPLKYFNGMNAIASTGGPVGWLLLPSIVDKLNYKYGWRGSLWILGALSMNSGFVGCLMKETKMQAGDNSDAHLNHNTVCLQTSANSATNNKENDPNKRYLQYVVKICELFGFGTVKRYPSFLIELTAFFILDLALYGWFSLQFIFLTSVGVSLFHVSAVLALGCAGSLAGRLLLFPLNKLMPEREYARPVMFVSALCASFALFLYSFDVSHWWWWGILSFLTGLFAGTTTPIYTALLKEKFPEEHDFDSAVGLHYTARGLGVLLGGLMYEGIGNFKVVFCTLAGFQCVGGVLVVLGILRKKILRRRYHREHKYAMYDSNNQPTTYNLVMEVELQTSDVIHNFT